jgi:uncharacterized protein YheU (UPF0270 family)
MRIPHTALADATLCSLIEEFVTREGTDYGDRIYSLADKVAQVRRQLDQGSVVIVYDPHTESAHIMPSDAVPDDAADHSFAAGADSSD